MIYQRATKGTMDMWAKQLGDDSYSWDNFLPYYQKSVAFTPPKNPPRAANATAKYKAEAFPPKSGPLRVSYANYAGPFSSWIQGSLNEIGIPPVDDFNSGSLMGAQYCSSTIDPESQTRESSETSFLAAAKGRKNLHVYTKTRGKRVLFDARKQAIGVEVQGVTLPYNITAKREVIVSAGAFQSPQLLMVSGIGPKATLDKFKIPLLSDLPAVGQGMEVRIWSLIPCVCLRFPNKRNVGSHLHGPNLPRQSGHPHQNRKLNPSHPFLLPDRIFQQKSRPPHQPGMRLLGLGEGTPNHAFRPLPHRHPRSLSLPRRLARTRIPLCPRLHR